MRVHTATRAIGPLGHLLGSPSTARVLSLFTTEPYRRFTLGEIRAQTCAAKGTIQACLHRLEQAELVQREGRGAATAYRYAAEGELAQRMLGVVTASQARMVPPAEGTFADSMAQWVAAAQSAAGTEHLGRAEAAPLAPEPERIARLKRLPKTTIDQSAPRPIGPYAL